jgi:hypothetical protein
MPTSQGKTGTSLGPDAKSIPVIGRFWRVGREAMRTAPGAGGLDLLFLSSLFLFTLPGILASTTFPPYYEDESWTYLAIFEALRGNGFSWHAFHEGSSIGGTFNLICAPLAWISPLSPEATVRAISLIFCLLTLLAVYFLARRVAGSYAYVAPLALMLTPLWFLRARYGRLDVIATGLAMAGVASAPVTPWMAGFLAGMAVTMQPVLVWVGTASLALFAEKGSCRDVRRYVGGGLAAVSIEVAWIVSHWADFRSISTRYFVTSSVSHGWAAWIESLAQEGGRYAQYARSLGSAGAALQAGILLLLPLIAILQARRRTRVVLIALTVTPLAALALLVRGKNPLYFLYALPALSVAAAAGARRLPAALVKSACVVALCWFGFYYMKEVRRAESAPRAEDAVEAVAAGLPHNATVFAPLLFAGIIRRRPDLQFFSYHALSLRTSWHLPPCSAISSSIKSLMAGDGRVTGLNHRVQPDRVFLVKHNDEIFMQYLKSIYVDATPADLRCLTGNQAPVRLRICGGDSGGCFEADIVERLLDDEHP